MKNIGVIFILLIASFSFCLAVDEPTNPIGDENINQINQNIEQIPIGDDGKIDPTKITNITSKAEVRIQKINDFLKKTDKFFMFVFKIPLRLSWEFVYLVFFVLLSLSTFHNLSNFLFRKELFSILVSFTITFFLGYLSIFFYIVTFINKITSKWWWDLVVFFTLLVLIVIYFAFSKSMIARLKKKRAEKAQESLIQSSKSAKEDAESTGKIAKSFEEGVTQKTKPGIES